MDVDYAKTVIADCYGAWQNLMDGGAGEDASVAALTRERRASLQGAGTVAQGLRGDLSGLDALPEAPTGHGQLLGGESVWLVRRTSAHLLVVFG